MTAGRVIFGIEDILSDSIKTLAVQMIRADLKKDRSRLLTCTAHVELLTFGALPREGCMKRVVDAFSGGTEYEILIPLLSLNRVQNALLREQFKHISECWRARLENVLYGVPVLRDVEFMRLAQAYNMHPVHVAPGDERLIGLPADRMYFETQALVLDSRSVERQIDHLFGEFDPVIDVYGLQSGAHVSYHDNVFDLLYDGMTTPLPPAVTVLPRIEKAGDTTMQLRPLIVDSRAQLVLLLSQENAIELIVAAKERVVLAVGRSQTVSQSDLTTGTLRMVLLFDPRVRPGVALRGPVAQIVAPNLASLVAHGEDQIRRVLQEDESQIRAKERRRPKSLNKIPGLKRIRHFH